MPTKGLCMKDTTISTSLRLPNEALLFDLDELYTRLQTIPDQRKKRGVRYSLASLLMIAVLAKLAGQDSSRGMSHWAKLRTQEIRQVFQLKRASMPHSSTWSRVLGHGVEPEEVEQIVGQFFAQTTTMAHPKRGSIQLAIDGKTRRRNHPFGRNGRRPFASYLPAPTRQGHGRLDKRAITVSRLLANYSDWPELAPVFKLERHSTNTLGKTKTQVRYGITSLPAHLANPQRLLELTRGRWGIENGLHYRRDVTLR